MWSWDNLSFLEPSNSLTGSGFNLDNRQSFNLDVNINYSLRLILNDILEFLTETNVEVQRSKCL